MRRSISLLLGCACLLLPAACNSTAPRRPYDVPRLSDFRYPTDFGRQTEKSDPAIHSNQRFLRQGMSSEAVRNLLGKPKSKMTVAEKVEMWSYPGPVGGTHEFWVVFVDGKLDFFGVAQTSWLIDQYEINPEGGHLR